MSAPVTLLVLPFPGTDPNRAAALLRKTAGIPCEAVIVPVPSPAALNAAIRSRLGNDIVVVAGALEIQGKEWLARLSERLAADPQLGAVGGKFLDQLGLIYSCGRSIVSRFGMREHLANLGYGESDAEKYQRFTDVDAILPWLLLIRREALDAVGGFDETFATVPAAGPARPPWLETDDLCLGLRAKGWSVKVEPAVVAIHPAANTYKALEELQKQTTITEIDPRLVNLWLKKWRWNPGYPDLNAVRERWLETPLCWRIGQGLRDNWAASAEEPAVDLLLVTRNNLGLLAPMLDSLAKTTYRNAILRVHLNGSTDGSKAHLESLRATGYPFPIELVETPVNLGYTPAINWLFHSGQAPLAAKLDDDIELSPDWLERMVAVLRAHPYAGAVGAKIVNFETPDTLLWADYRLWPQGNNNQGVKDQGQFDFLTRTIANMGCSLLYRRKAWEKAGPFDIGLNPVSWDDLDHQIALWAAGYDVLSDGRIAVKHPFKRLRDHCRRTAGNMRGNGTKVIYKWGHGAFQLIDHGLDLAGRKL